MFSLRSCVLAPSLIALACAAETEQTPVSEAPRAAESATGIELRVEPFADFFFLVRAQAADVVPREPWLKPVIDAWLPVQEEVGAFGGFWRFDLAGMLSTSPQEFGEWFAESPESAPSRRGGDIPIRGPGLRMAEAMREPWAVFLESKWPQRREQLEAVRRQLDRDFMPKHREAFRYMLASLGISDPEIELPTYLALEIHPPGASTYRTRSGPVAVLSVNDLLGEGRFSDLTETLLHESTHAFDLSSRGDGDAFSSLRARLSEQGMGADDPRLRDVPHLIMFVQSEETMRRLFDAEHVAYGDTQRGDIAPLYERSGVAATVVRREWRRYLDGELSMDEALDRIAASAI